MLTTASQLAKDMGVSRADLARYIELLAAEALKIPEAENGVTPEIARQAAEATLRKQAQLLNWFSAEWLRYRRKGLPLNEHPFMEMLAHEVYAAFEELRNHQWEMQNL